MLDSLVKRSTRHRRGGWGGYHLRGDDHAAFQDLGGLGAKGARVPDDQVGELADLDASDQVRHALRDGRVDGILADVAFDAEVVRAGALVLLEGPTLCLVLVRGVPGAQDHLAAAAHGLRIRGHHADGAEVVQDVLGGDGLGADPGLGEGDILGDVLGQMMTDHQHVQVFVQGVHGKRTRWVCATGQHVGVLHDGDDIGCVATAGPLRVVGVDGAVLERFDGLLHEAGFIQCVRMDHALNVEFVAHVQAGVDRSRG